jgi:murein DD-endopeptidase MepM/ murein hydrolase activator NlpD
MRRIRQFFYLLVLALALAGVLYFLPHFEASAPTVDIKLEAAYVGLRPFDIMVREHGTGLRRMVITLGDAHGVAILLEHHYPQPVFEQTLRLTLNPQILGRAEGTVELRVLAEDRSYRRIVRGNRSIQAQTVTLDFTPPQLTLQSREHYLNHGGSGLVLYRASADTVRSGVRVGDTAFPGHKGIFPTPDMYLALFAFPYHVAAQEKVVLFAEDVAGNTREIKVPYQLKEVQYRKSTLQISDEFIDSKIRPLLGAEATPAMPRKEIFLKVNRDLRQSNDAMIHSIGQHSAPVIRWEEAFHQLSNSKVEANFADARTYLYGGEVIDHQVHLGYDLAVTRHYPIAAANHGMVVFAGDLGIYGNTVIIDHGCGLQTLYAHMSSIDVGVGDLIQRQQTIGKTGDTGLAVGDHLHYGVYVHGVPVRPLEWWDEKWVDDNIFRKMRMATESAVSGSRQERTLSSGTPQPAPR